MQRIGPLDGPRFVRVIGGIILSGKGVLQLVSIVVAFVLVIVMVDDFITTLREGPQDENENEEEDANEENEPGPFGILYGIIMSLILLALIILLIAFLLMILLLLGVIAMIIGIAMSVLTTIAGIQMIRGRKRTFVLVVLIMNSLPLLIFLFIGVVLLISFTSINKILILSGLIMISGYIGFMVLSMALSWPTFKRSSNDHGSDGITRPTVATG